MSETVYLKDASGEMQEYTFEKGVKLSDGQGGQIAFVNGGSDVAYVIGSANQCYPDSSKTFAELRALLEAAYATFTVPSGHQINEIYSSAILSGGVNIDGSAPIVIPEPINEAYWETVVTQTQNQDGSITVRAQWHDKGSAAVSALSVGTGGSLCTEVILVVVYT